MVDRTALDTRAQLVTTKLVMETGQGSHQGRESWGDRVRLMDQMVGAGLGEGVIKDAPRFWPG